MTTISDALRVAAGHGLPHPECTEWVASVDEPEFLLDVAAVRRVSGLLDQAMAEGAVRCGADIAKLLLDQVLGAAAWQLLVERHLLVVHHLLDDAAVPHRFIKGPAVAHRYYDHPGLRSFVDLDVLVPPGALDDAVGALATAGHVRTEPDPYPGFARRWAKSVTMRHTETRIEVDVHRILPDGPFGYRASPDLVWQRPEHHVGIGGVDVPMLDPVAAFVHACLNAVASYDRVALAALRDVAEIAPAVVPDVDDVRGFAEAMGVRACITDAVTRVRDRLAWLPPAEIAAMADWPVSHRERAWLESYRSRPSDVRRVSLALRAIPSPAGKLAYATSAARLLTGRAARRRDTGPPCIGCGGE